jgi:thiamine biosynthesis lipoprotein
MALKKLALLIFALALVGCGREPLVKRESYVFGTRVEVQVWGEPQARADVAADAVLREVDRLHRAYHAWQPSELTALNDAIAAGRPQTISAELATLLRESAAFSAAGEYLFDPGVGGLVTLWGFHDDTFAPRLPDPERLKALRVQHPSIADLSLDGQTASSRNRALALDFGGYLKGVALDRAAEMLKAQGIRNAIINIGGNIMALGNKGGKPWRVGIQHPREGGPMASLELRDGEAIGTSGDYQRYFELEGKRYCHLIDPRSGAPAEGTQAVSILVPPGARAGMRSDAGSKPLFIAGADWPRLASKLALTHVLRVDSQGQIEVTAALKARLRFEMSDLRVKALP